MKIETGGSERLNSAQPENAAALERARSSGSAAEIGPAKKDQAALSDRARLLSKARAALAQTPDVRADRVNALRAQMQSGQYQVRYEQLAGRLLRSVTDG